MRTKLLNPYFKKISDEHNISGKPASYGSIAIKVLFFLLLTGAGVCAYVFNVVPEEYINYALIGAGVITMITSLINFFNPKGTPIFGSLFCIAEGFLVGWLCQVYSVFYYGVVPIAIGVTFVVILVMLFLYATRIIKVGQRFRAVVSTLFLTSFILYGLVFVSSFFTNAITSLVWGNSGFGIAISAGALLLAALNLVVDYDNIAQCVKNKYSNRYEWSLAFGLVMTIILIFIRVLRLLSKIMSKGND
ncbi:membrane protein [Vallitalea longa]|uniref:Membrane protein n=1 Tax=Vallitalea longa TaxID=2936439 RepID=A0A9W5YAB3_9FIRM|nr:Bax inhibitor-1/YccA family protein [Vallitalea longa]GKX30262.1 membrane protein [Vallitalea longa]